MAGETETVLVVDDDAAIRLLCRVNLELEGYRVLEAATIPEARAKLEAEDVRVVLLDVHVGADDGRHFLKELRAGAPGLPVAFFTGSADPAAIAEFRPDGMIPKPFGLDDLVQTVRRLADAAAS